MNDGGDVCLLLLRERLTLVEATQVAQDKLGGSLEAIAKILGEQVDNRRLSAQRRPMVRPNALGFVPPINLRESTVATTDLLAWLDQLPPSAANQPTAPFTSSKWPWGTHETDLLLKLAEAAERFWARYDPTQPDTAPTNKQVTDWLENQGVAKRSATVMATILRVDGLPTGPRRSS